MGSSTVLPKCSVPGCRLWVWNNPPTHTQWSDGRPLIVLVPKSSEPLSNKCWYHHHGKPVPEGAS